MSSTTASFFTMPLDEPVVQRFKGAVSWVTRSISTHHDRLHGGPQLWSPRPLVWARQSPRVAISLQALLFLCPTLLLATTSLCASVMVLGGR